MRVVKVVALAASTALVAALGGCGGGSDDKPTPSSPTTSTTTNADGTTTPGTELKIGKPAVVRFRADKQHSSLTKLKVVKVNKGKIRDLSRFELNDAARASTVYYVSSVIKNLGPDTLSGKLVLYGKVSKDLVVPPVVFGSSFPTCDYKPLPKKFKEDDSVTVCMVMLAPKHGKISEIQWRAADNSEPISWTVKK